MLIKCLAQRHNTWCLWGLKLLPLDIESDALPLHHSAHHYILRTHHCIRQTHHCKHVTAFCKQSEEILANSCRTFSACRFRYDHAYFNLFMPKLSNCTNLHTFDAKIFLCFFCYCCICQLLLWCRQYNFLSNPCHEMHLWTGWTQIRLIIQ